MQNIYLTVVHSEFIKYKDEVIWINGIIFFQAMQKKMLSNDQMKKKNYEIHDHKKIK